MRTLDDRSHLSTNRRPKGADIDRPVGYIKRNLRRKWRVILKRSLELEVVTNETPK